MKSFSHHYLTLAITATLAVPLTAEATNGYFALGYGMKNLGMAGAAAANPQDAMIAATNPAGMADAGDRVDLGIQFFNPPRKVAGERGSFDFQTPTRTAPVGYAHSGSNEFLIPNMGVNFSFNRKVSVGLSFVGNGANTRYKENFFELTGVPPNRPYGTLGVQLIQAQMLPTITYKPAKTQALGASLVIGIQQFRAYGLAQFDTPLTFIPPGGVDVGFEFSQDKANLTNRGNDSSYGAGARVGYLGHFFGKKFSLGASYGSKVYMSKFDKYRGLFARDGEFDIPENYVVGIAVRPTKKLTVAFDAQRILYSDVPAVGNRHPTTSIQDFCTRPIGTPQEFCGPGVESQPVTRALGAPDSFGFGWRDQTAYKLGASYQLNKRWIVRSGINYGESPVPDDQLLFNLLAPAITERHAALGFSYLPSKSTEVNFSYVHAFKHSQICAAPECKTILTQGEGSYVAAQLYYHALGVSFALKF